MAELSVPGIEFEITADGSAAIQELEKTAEAAEKVADAATDLGSGANGLEELGSAAQQAGSEMQTAAKSAQEFGKQAEAGAKKASASLKEIGEKMSSIGKGMTMAVSVPIVGALAASVSGASDLTETLGKTDVVFGELTDRVLNWSNSSVESMGLAQQTALDMAATYGDMATGMGLSQTAAADMATTLVQLGADMASFKNIGIDEVNSAMTAVFTGETESLKRLGIVMTQTNLQQFALTQGITENIAQMSQAEQVQLRYNYVLAMTKNAQGDFARTGGNLANQTRALGETIKQMGNEFGAVLVPAVTKVVSALREGVQGISEMDDGTKRMIVAVGMVVAAVGPLLLVGGKVITMIASIKTAMASLTINPWVLGIGAAVAAIAGLSLAMKALEPEVDTTSDSYQNLKRSIEGGAQGEVSIDATDLETLDTSKLDELPENVAITITADGEQALQEAKSIVETLDTDPQFDGKLAIDGDPEKAEQVIAQIQADIAAVEEAVKIDGDPEEANAAISQLETDLATLKRAVPITEDPATQAALNARIAELTAKLAIIKGSISIDMSSLPKSVEVEITADGQKAIDTAQGILNDLTSGEYDGSLAIDGDPAKAEQVIAQIQSDITAVEEAVKIDGDDAAAQEAIANLQGDIDALEGLVVITEDPTARAELDSKLAELKAQLDTLKGSITLSYSTEGESALDSLKEKLDALPKDETYKNTGEFTTTGMDATQIQAYAEALAAAASATGDYKEAVKSLNQLVDQDTQRKTGEVNQQLAEQYRYLTAQYNDGILTEEQYTQQVSEANEAATEKIKSIQKEAEVQKELNKQLANGTRRDDAKTTAEQLKTLFADEHISAEEGMQAGRRILNDEYGEGDTTAKQIDAGTQLIGMVNQQKEAYQGVVAAVQEYNAAMAEANNLEQNGAQIETEGGGSMSAKDALERAELMQQAVQRYADITSNGDTPAQALEKVTEQFGEQLSAYDGLEQSLQSALTNSDGNLMNFQEARQAAEESAALVQDYQGQIESAAQEAQQKRQDALSTLQATMSELNQGYTEAETNAMLSQIEASGVSVDEATKAMLNSAPEMISGLASAIESGDSSQIQAAIDGILANVDLSGIEDTGGNVDAGLANSIRDNIGEAEGAATELGNATIDATNEAAGCASPSTKTEETGRNLIAGLVNGLQDTSAITGAAQAVGEAAATAISDALSNLDLSGALSQGTGSGMDAGGMAAAITSAISSAAISAAGLAVNQGRSVGNALAVGTGTGVTSGANNIRSAINSAINSAAISAASLAVNQGHSVGNGLSTGTGAGVTSGAGNIRSAITSAVNSAASSARSGASSQGRAIGSALISGARSGVMSAASSLASAARSAVANAVAAAKAAANIHSPSRTMRDEVGVMLMRGVEVGLSERTPTTLQMIQESMRGLISGATAVVNSNGIPAPAVAIPAPGGPSIDYERLADANASRPVILNVGAKRMAQATRDESARQQAIRVAQINAGYGGR